MILDHRGQPIRKGELQRELAEPTMGGVRSIVQQTHVGIDPAAIGAALRAAETGDPIHYLDLAEKMEETDLHYLAVLGTRRRQVSQLKITVEPADDGAEAERDADLVRQWIRAANIQEVLFDLLDAVGKGFAVMEILWETSADQWMVSRLKYRLPQWFRYDDVTGARLQRRDDQGGWRDLEAAKFCVHEHRAKSGLPIRGGLARCAAWAWGFKHFGVRDWLRFIEAYGHPLRIGRYDRGATETEKEILLRAVSQIATDFAAIIPESMRIEFVENSGTGMRSDLYQHLLNYFDAAISKAVLGQTLTTQEGDSGSYSLGQIHDEVRRDIEKSDAGQIAHTLTAQVVAPLVLLNHGARRSLPRIVIGREDEFDPTVTADTLAKLLPHGFTVKVDQVRQRLGYDPPGPDDAVLGTKPAGGAGPQDRAALIAALAREGKDVDAIDAIVDELLTDSGWEPVMAPIIEPLLAAASSADGLAAFRAALPGLFERMDDSDLVRLLHRLSFSGRLSGNAGLEQDE